VSSFLTLRPRSENPGVAQPVEEVVGRGERGGSIGHHGLERRVGVIGPNDELGLRGTEAGRQTVGATGGVVVG
jgi:hypothetical protein